jgi:hypothetical protein
MVTNPVNENIHDPIEFFSGTLEDIWDLLCETYDVSCSIPDMDTIMYEVDMSDPDRAAHDIMVNLITEVIEQVSRFSSWYTKPSRAFGIVSVASKIHLKTKQILAPEAVMKWHDTLDSLSDAIRMNSGVIEASLLVNRLMDDLSSDKDPHIVVSCECIPRVKIRLKKSILVKAELMCDNCNEKFHILY